MKGKFIKKLVAYALTAAMVVSTPMTAFASEFADNFWIPDGVDENDPSSSGTGTVSTSDTNTTVLVENSASIKGIKVKPAAVTMKVGETETLEAEIIYEETETAKISDDDKKKIETQLKWRTNDLSVVTVGARKGSMTKCPVTARKNGFAIVTVGLDFDNDGVDEVISSVNVMVKRDIDSVGWNIPEGKLFYAGHTYDLHEFALVNNAPADKTDDIAFSVAADTKKEASVDGDGILTVAKKAPSKEVKAFVSASSAKVVPAETTIKLDPGKPIKKMKASVNKVTLDFGDAYNADGTRNNAENLIPTVTAKIDTVEPADHTDDIVWTSKDNKIATVKADSKDQKQATITAKSVGKTTITATSTSGKKVNFTVTVKATLKKLGVCYINEKNESGKYETWSGKTTPVYVERIPSQNTDKLKINVEGDKKYVKAKNQNIIPSADLTKNNGTATVTISAIESKTKKTSDKCTVTVKQSDVELKGVGRSKGADGKGAIELNYKKAERFNPSNKTITYYPIIGDIKAPSTLAEAIETVSWESSKETVATIANGKLKVVGEGSAKITVSAVKGETKGSKTTYKAKKYSFNVKSTPKCEEIVLKSNTATVLSGKTASIQVKQQLPKKAADPITWYVNGVKQTDPKKFTDKKATVSASDANADGVIELLATTGSVSVEARVYVVSAKVKKVNATMASTVELGKFTTITELSTDNNEPIVRIDVDKNSAKLVKVIPVRDPKTQNITGAAVFGIGKGKANVSVVSASGKATKLKIEVK